MNRIANVKIFGERNTGTNYLRRLIDANLECEQLPGTVPHVINRVRRRFTNSEAPEDWWFAATERINLGWKHRYIDQDSLSRIKKSSSVYIVFLIKNPYSWIHSMSRRPYHRRSAFGSTSVAALCATPWKTVGREHGPAEYASIGQMWAHKLTGYLSVLEGHPSTIVRYEDLVEDPESEIDRIARRTGFRRYSSDFKNLSKSTKDSDRSFEFYSSFYRTEAWRQSMTDEEYRLINTTLDRGLMEKLGYKWITTDD